MAEELEYPTELERAVVLKDGTELRLRPIRPEDAPRLIDFYDRLSRHTAYQRFFTIMKRRRFRAYVLADNTRMLTLLSRSTNILERSIEAGVATILFERRQTAPVARHQ